MRSFPGYNPGQLHCVGFLGKTLNIPPGGGGAKILLVASCYRNQDKLRPDGPLGSYADFTLPYRFYSQGNLPSHV